MASNLAVRALEAPQHASRMASRRARTPWPSQSSSALRRIDRVQLRRGGRQRHEHDVVSHGQTREPCQPAPARIGRAMAPNEAAFRRPCLRNRLGSDCSANRLRLPEPLAGSAHARAEDKTLGAMIGENRAVGFATKKPVEAVQPHGSISLCTTAIARFVALN
jgi:hypothetical protein